MEIGNMVLSAQYKKDFAYLEDLSNRGRLHASNDIYKNLKAKAQNLPELKRALDTLNVQY
jgi:hypothetical protein